MEDKKIIHGVDVTYCLNYQPDFKEDYDVKIKHFCCENHNSCESINNQNCYFKQMDRLEVRVKVLEEENEGLKAQRDTYISLMNIYKNISKGRQDSKNVTDYIERLEQKLNAQFAEMEEKVTEAENKNFELQEKLKIAKEALQYYADGEYMGEAKIQGSDAWRYVVDDNYTDAAKQALKQMEEVK